MHSYYYTKHNFHLFNSLNRFYKYIFNEELGSLPINSDAIKNELLFVLSEEKEEKELIDFLVENEELIVITLGFDYKSSVNIINFPELKNSFQQFVKGNYEEVEPRFTKDEIKEKLKNFFHSHGEESLFEYLNLAYYFLSNGPEQFINNEITYEEYKTNFLSPGLKNWERFKSRFHKYRVIIKLSNYKATLNELESAINEADSYVTKLSGLTGQNLIEEKSNFFKENVEKFKRIDDILSAFYRKLSFAVSSLQNTIGG